MLPVLPTVTFSKSPNVTSAESQEQAMREPQSK